VNTRLLLEDLRGQDVRLKADGRRLVVDAPAGAITDEMRVTLAEHKAKLLKLLAWERRKLKEADHRGLVIKRSKEPGWIALHDPITGEWHEIKESECLPGVVETANRYRQKGGVR
jgi:hypothetical protein